MVDYHLKQELLSLRVCLYCPDEQNIDEQFKIESLANFIDDCAWQISNGQNIKRFPFHLAPALPDAEKAETDMKRNILEMRRKDKQHSNENSEQPTEKRYSWGYSG